MKLNIQTKIFLVIFIILTFIVQNGLFATENQDKKKDYMNKDIPPIIIDFTHEKNKKLPHYITGYWYKYLTPWKDNLEIYVTGYVYESTDTDLKKVKNNIRISGKPSIIIYDCHKPRKPSLEEIYDINWFLPKYLTNPNIKSEHICHKDLIDFNQHNQPNPYKKTVKYHTPRYIPNTVVKYIDKYHSISWYPGATDRYIKYLTTYENKYEVYFVYWKERNTKNYSNGKYILYDCQDARSYKNNKERVELIFLSNNTYNSKNIPNFCSSKKNVY